MALAGFLHLGHTLSSLRNEEGEDMPGKRKDSMDIREILRRLRKGQSNRAVAKALGIDRKTLREKLKQLEQSLGLRPR